MIRYHLQITAEYDDHMEPVLDELAGAGLIAVLQPDAIDMIESASEGAPMIVRVLKD